MNNLPSFLSEFFPQQTSFDAIRHYEKGVEYWYARELMPILGYRKWERFVDAIDRARVTCKNSGFYVENHLSSAGFYTRGIPSDYKMSRFFCYLTAMNGDPRKPEIASAQCYFATKTIIAEAIEATNLESTQVPQASPIPPKKPRPFVETSQISEHQLRVFCFMMDLPDRWLSSQEIAQGAGVNPRTSRQYCKYFTEAGLFDMIEVFPGHRYRFSGMAEKRNPAIYKRLMFAIEATGNPLTQLTFK